MELEAKKISDILDITEQQFNILVSVYKLESEGRATNPSQIIEEYATLYGKKIQKSNFFRHTKQLQEKKLIRRNRRANYAVNFHNIKKNLAEKRTNLVWELEEFDKITAQTEEYFKRLAFESTRPLVQYLGHDELFNKIARSLKDAITVYISADFPTTAYTYHLADGIGRKKYLEVIWDRCLKKEELQVNYLTTLDIDIPFNHAFRVHGDPRQAYNETKIVIEQLSNQTEKHEKLDIRHMKEPHGMDVLIPERKEPLEFYMFTRDEHKDIIGGIHIRSPQTAHNAKKTFLRDYEYAEKIRGEQGKKIIQNLQQEFEKKYGICKE